MGSAVVPIGGLFALVLAMGNGAYLYLSVSFIQMLKVGTGIVWRLSDGSFFCLWDCGTESVDDGISRKWLLWKWGGEAFAPCLKKVELFCVTVKASQPVVVFFVGNIFGTEEYSLQALLNVIVIGVGILTASYGELFFREGLTTSAHNTLWWTKLLWTFGEQESWTGTVVVVRNGIWLGSYRVYVCIAGEVNFVIIGVALQVFSVIAEAIRLTFIQIMLQKKGVKLNPISTLYYVAPCCFVFLIAPFFIFEAGPLMQSSFDFQQLVPLLILNSIAAFGM